MESKAFFYNIEEDNSGHSYAVPCNRLEEFRHWNLYGDGEGNWDEPDYAERVEGEGLEELLDYKRLKVVIEQNQNGFSVDLLYKGEVIERVYINQEDPIDALANIFTEIGIKTEVEVY